MKMDNSIYLWRFFFHLCVCVCFLFTAALLSAYLLLWCILTFTVFFFLTFFFSFYLSFQCFWLLVVCVVLAFFVQTLDKSWDKLNSTRMMVVDIPSNKYRFWGWIWDGGFFIFMEISSTQVWRYFKKNIFVCIRV